MRAWKELLKPDEAHVAEEPDVSEYLLVVELDSPQELDRLIFAVTPGSWEVVKAEFGQLPDAVISKLIMMASQLMHPRFDDRVKCTESVDDRLLSPVELRELLATTVRMMKIILPGGEEEHVLDRSNAPA